MTLEAAPDGLTTAKVYVVAPADPDRPETSELTFRLTDANSNASDTYATVFRSPAS